MALSMVYRLAYSMNGQSHLCVYTPLSGYISQTLGCRSFRVCSYTDMGIAFSYLNLENH